MEIVNFNVIYGNVVDKKEEITMNLKEISKFSKQNFSHGIVESLFEEYGDRESIEEKILILRILYKYFTNEISIEEAEKYLDLILFYINSSDGKIRNTFISIIGSFRIKLLFKSCFVSNDRINCVKFSRLNIKLVYSLMDLYEVEQDEKIKKSILKALFKVHSFGLEKIIEKTEYIFRYKEFKKLFIRVR